MWEIIDNNGTLYSGSEEEMKRIFDMLRYPENYSADDLEIVYEVEW